MTDVFLERTFDPPITTADFEGMLAEGASCFGLYRVAWGGSLMSADGRKLFCQFDGPDAESVRTALRKINAAVEYLWPGTIHDAPGVTDEDVATSNVLVRRRFDEPVALEDIQAIEDEGADCLEMRKVTFVRTFFSADRKNMVCLYHAPDAESVRQAQEKAGVPLEQVWAFQRFSPQSP